jgi:hypothetical protein
MKKSAYIISLLLLVFAFACNKHKKHVHPAATEISKTDTGVKEAPKHGSPDQDVVDSIKKAKKKGL